MKQSTQTNRLVPLILVAWLVAAAGCAMHDISTSHVWRDSARGDAPLGKTLVLSLSADSTVSTPLENEWTRQLRNRGIEVEATNTLQSADRPLNEPAIIALVKAGGFDTLLLSRLIKVKKVSRDASHSQVAVIETKLYDAGTGKPFWTAQADVFIVTGADNQMREPKDEKLRRYVEAMMQEMARSQVL